MSAFKQKIARLGATAGVLAVSTAAIMAVGGASASSALAATECPNNAHHDIEGRGSSLQKVAQQEWTGREVPSNEVKAIPHTLLSPERGYAKACKELSKEFPRVSYTSTSSGSGLTTFRFNGTGKVETGANEGETHGYSFVGSDDAPNKAQIENAEAAAGGAKPLIIPTIETSIAVVYNPPENCTLTFDKTHGITYAQLNEVFGGSGIKAWTGFTKASPTGTGCSGAITRVVRAEGSGTTFQFKNYLATASTVGMPCELTGYNETTEKEEKTKEWAKMKAIKLAGEAPNTTWPNPKVGSAGECAGTTTVETAAGGGALVKYIAAHPGTIGYASLPDVKSTSNNPEGKAKIAWLQNTNSEAVVYATPENAEKEESNCGERVYTVPAGGREGESGVAIDWSKVFGAKPTVGGTLYPLCTLTYDIAWNHYEKVKYAESANTAADVKAYLNSYVLGAGQSVKHWYQPLPHPTGNKENNVLAAAQLAAGLIAN